MLRKASKPQLQPVSLLREHLPAPTNTASTPHPRSISETKTGLSTTSATVEMSAQEQSACNSTVQAWTGKEEDALVAGRHDRDEQFIKSKNHSTLWKAIADDIGTVSPLQAMHKYDKPEKKREGSHRQW